MHKFSLKKGIEWYQSRFFLSRSLRLTLLNKNLNNLFIALIFVLFYGVGNLVYDIIVHHNQLDFYNQELVYFSFYIIVSLLGMICSKISNHLKKIPYVVRNLPYVFSLVAFCAIDIFTFIVMHNSFRGLVLFACYGIVCVLCLYAEPLLFMGVLVLNNIFVDKIILQEFGKEGLLDILILSGLLLFLSLYKQKITKHDLLRTKMLEENRDALQDAVATQIEEIQTQNKEIEIQHKKIIDIQNNTIIGLSNLVENRDSDTGEHVRRTSAYVNLIAQKARNNGFYTEILTDEYISLLTKAAPMHDIGKIVVSDEILKKPGRLNEAEFAQIKRHTTEGGRIVLEILGESEDQEYVKLAWEVATGHHERWDGEGYPNGLIADAIPLSARIMAIADVFDALVSPRCYKEPFSIEKAMSIIKEESGSHFDPILVKLFVSMEDDAVAIMEKYKD